MPEQTNINLKNGVDMAVDLSQKVSHIEDKMDDLSNEVREMREQMKEIYTAIVGDKKFGHQGLVHRVEDLEKVKKKWENKVNWLYGYVLGAGTLLAVIIELVKSQLK